MNAVFAGCSTVVQVIESIDRHLALGDNQVQGLEDAERWSLRGIRRCLRVLQDPTASFSDRAAILRELTRLAGGTLSFPTDGSGIADGDWTGLRHYGVSARPQSDG